MTAADDACRTREKARVTRDSTLNFGGAAAASVLSIVRAILIPRLLPSVGAYGVLNFLNLFRTYSPYVNLGVLMGYGIEVPCRRGQDRESGVARFTNSAFTFSFLATAAFALAMAATAAGWWAEFQPEFRVGLLIFAAVIVLQNMFLFYKMRLRVELNFLLRNQAEVAMAIGFTTIAVAGAAFFGVYAVFAGLLLGEAAGLWWLWRRDPFRARWQFDGPAVVTLVKIGIPVTIVACLNGLIFDIDLILIKWFFPGWTELGLYGLGVTFSQFTMMIPLTVGHALATRIYQEAGRPAAERDLYRYLRKPTVLMGASALLLNGLLYLLIAPVVILYLPRYLPGLAAMKILLWYTTFLAIVNTVSFVFDGMKRFYQNIALQVALLGLNVAMNLTFFARGWGIEGVAAATLITYVAYGVVALVYALFLCRQRPGTIAGFIGLLAVGIAYVMAVTVGIDWVLPAAGGAGRLLGLTALKLVIYALAILPVLAGLERWQGTVSELRGLVGEMIRRRKDNG